MGACELSLPSATATNSTSKSNDKLGDEITLLAGQINAATYRFLKLIAEFDRREAWSGAGIRSCAHWLNWKCGIAIGAAREKVRVARCLELLPKINQAFEKGELSFSKVRAMTRVANNENEDYLLMIAENGTASHIEKLVSKYQGVKHQQDPKQTQSDRHQQTRTMSSYQDDDDMWHLNAKLPAEVGAMVIKAIDAILADEKLRDEKEKAEKNVSAETPFEHKRVDALAKMAEHYLATASNEEGAQSLKGSERCQVMLHVDMKTLQSHHTEGCCTHKHSSLDNEHWISPDTAKRLSCDASLVTVLEDDKGKVLNIGRRSRTIPPAIHRALTIRDSSCSHPGCCATNYLDAHHIKHWADGGETSLDNLVMLCRHHHRELHGGVFDIKVENSECVFINAKGKVIDVCPTVVVPTNAVTLSEQELNIDKSTAVSKWMGEAIDYDMAVDGLFPKLDKVSASD